jgi:hypothetical protein
MKRPLGALVIAAIVTASTGAAADEFDDYAAAVKGRAGTTFAFKPVDGWTRRTLFVRRDFLAHLAGTAVRDAQPTLNVTVDGQQLQLDDLFAVIHTGDLDCSVNKICWSCEGKGWFARGLCELGRANCAAFQAPRIALCAAAKAANNTELAHLKFHDPGHFPDPTLKLLGVVSDFQLSIDPHLESAHAQPLVTLSATLHDLHAGVGLHPVLGIFGIGCLFRPTISAPDIGISAHASQVALDPSISIDPLPADAPERVDLSLTLQNLNVRVELQTGDVLDWIKSNPVLVLSCELPALAAFVWATTVQEKDLTVLKTPVTKRLASMSLSRDGRPVRVTPQKTPEAIGLIEAPEHTP